MSTDRENPRHDAPPPGDREAGEADGASPVPPPAPPPSSSSSPASGAGRVWLLVGAAGLLAGLASWLGGEATHGAYSPVFVEPDGWEEMSPYEKPSVMASQLKQAMPAGESRNAAVAFGMLGAALGAGLGLAGGLSRGAPRSGAVAAAVGLALGGAAGAGMSLAVGPTFFQYVGPRMGLLPPALVHGGIWVPVGMAAGLAFGVGTGDRGAIVQGIIGGGLGALFGTIAFEAINAAAFPLVRVEAPVPGSATTRLLAHLCVALLTALGVGFVIADRHRSRKKAAAPSPMD